MTVRIASGTFKDSIFEVAYEWKAGVVVYIDNYFRGPYGEFVRVAHYFPSEEIEVVKV